MIGSQVLVYLPVFYNKFYNKCVVNKCSESDMVMFLSPTYTEYQGQLLSVGSKESVEKWMDSALQVQDSKMGSTYVSLYALKSRPDLCAEIVALMDDHSAAVVGLHLKIISSFLADPVKRKWFTEVLDNHLKLREVNLWATCVLHSLKLSRDVSGPGANRFQGFLTYASHSSYGLFNQSIRRLLK